MAFERIPHFVGTPTRRDFLQAAGAGFGSLALAGIFADEATANQVITPQKGAKAKRVIWLFMNGGQSQVDTWDYKPQLAKLDGQELKGFDNTTGFFADSVGPIMKSPFQFAQHGKSGTWASEIFPEISKHVDDMAFIHSCYTETNNHSPALFQINTGSSRMGYPSVGAWVTYGLGTMNKSLPSFVVMVDTLGRGLPKGYAQNWGSGFLPGVFQGTGLRHQGQPIDDLARSQTDTAQRAQLDLLGKWNKAHLKTAGQDPRLAARIESFELAYRMQMAAPEALEIAAEPQSVRDMYGVDRKECGHFARQCLMARRLAEKGVRFIQLYSGGEENEKSWDGHTDIAGNHRGFASETDRPIAALLTDLKQRGMLEDTLVVCCGEFGRLPLVQRGGTGRDHNPHAFTCWMAGGGVKAGVHHGETDELGHKAVKDRVSINDLHATILALLGIDHTELTYHFNGRNFRLTDVAGNVVKSVIA